MLYILCYRTVADVEMIVAEQNVSRVREIEAESEAEGIMFFATLLGGTNTDPIKIGEIVAQWLNEDTLSRYITLAEAPIFDKNGNFVK